MVTINDWLKFFPFKSVRKEQEIAIDFALNSYLEGKKCVLAELPTGCGKAAIGITVARYMQAQFELGKITLGGTYILTTQKVLQEQYMNDFGNDKGQLKLLKSSGSYTCQFFDDNNVKSVSCKEIQRLLDAKSPIGIIYKDCACQCRFKQAKEEFYNGVEGITNYQYFLTCSAYTTNMQRRGLLVMDEVHGLEQILSSFVKIAFSNFFYRTVLEVKTPGANASQKSVYAWLVKTCRPRLSAVIRDMQKKVKSITDPSDALVFAKRLEELKRNLSKIDYFIDVYDPETWVLDVSKTDKRGERIYEFKPIVVGEYAQRMLFAQSDRTLLLSATILDKDVYCEAVGLDPKDVAFMRLPSPFPVENRQVHFIPVGSMSKNNIEKTLPVMAQVVSEILSQHPTDKGIIHTSSFYVAKKLYELIGPERLLIHTSEDRDEVIKFHYDSKHPTVLISPSMMEGVDLADDRSRFQILCKIPFPNLGDAAILRRMELNKQWYAYQTVKSVVQALGRSIRSETDHAISYILDEDWERFYRINKKMFPSEFASTLS